MPKSAKKLPSWLHEAQGLLRKRGGSGRSEAEEAEEKRKGKEHKFRQVANVLLNEWHTAAGKNNKEKAAHNKTLVDGHAQFNRDFREWLAVKGEVFRLEQLGKFAEAGALMEERDSLEDKMDAHRASRPGIEASIAKNRANVGTLQDDGRDLTDALFGRGEKNDEEEGERRMTREEISKALVMRGGASFMDSISNEFDNPNSKLRTTAAAVGSAAANEVANPESLLRSSYIPKTTNEIVNPDSKLRGEIIPAAGVAGGIAVGASGIAAKYAAGAWGAGAAMLPVGAAIALVAAIGGGLMTVAAANEALGKFQKTGDLAALEKLATLAGGGKRKRKTGGSLSNAELDAFGKKMATAYDTDQRSRVQVSEKAAAELAAMKAARQESKKR